jgi:hypothetical protein
MPPNCRLGPHWDDIMKKPSIKEQRLADLENDFPALLLSCLHDCGRGRWGLFGQSDSTESEKFLHWDEARRLRDIASEIHDLRAEFGQPNPLVERFLYYRSKRGANVPGEPNLSGAFLDEIQRGDFAVR